MLCKRWIMYREKIFFSLWFLYTFLVKFSLNITKVNKFVFIENYLKNNAHLVQSLIAIKITNKLDIK